MIMVNIFMPDNLISILMFLLGQAGYIMFLATTKGTVRYGVSHSHSRLMSYCWL